MDHLLNNGPFSITKYRFSVAVRGRCIYITIIDIYGQMDHKIIISKKFGLCLSNIYDRDWKLEIAEEINDEINDRAKVAKK